MRTKLALILSTLSLVAILGVAVDVAHAGDDVPFKLRGIVALTGSTTLDDDPNYVIENTFAGEANATQLGKHSVEGTMIFTVSNTAVAGVPIVGSFTNTTTWTAANGDKLVVYEAGGFLVLPIDVGGSRLLFVPIAGQGAWQIVDGTGRFESATGSGTIETGLTAEGAITLEYEGVISSVGSGGGNGSN